MSEILDLKRKRLATLVENPGQVTVLQEMCRDFPPEAIREAFTAAQISGKKNLAWVLARLRGKERDSPRCRSRPDQPDTETVLEQNRQAVREFCGVGT